jgi:hypothetical protein
LADARTPPDPRDDPYAVEPAFVTEAERAAILSASPRGTFAVLVVYAVLFAALWLYFWYGLFLPAGVVR